MKKTLLLLVTVTSLFFTGCYIPNYLPKKLQTDCNAKDKKSMMEAVAAILVMNGFEITVANTDLGIITAKQVGEKSGLLGKVPNRTWIFNMKDGDLSASAKTDQGGGSSYAENEVYYDDYAHSDWVWYWNVRNAIERDVCKNAIIHFYKVQPGGTLKEYFPKKNELEND